MSFLTPLRFFWKSASVTSPPKVFATASRYPSSMPTPFLSSSDETRTRLDDLKSTLLGKTGSMASIDLFKESRDSECMALRSSSSSGDPSLAALASIPSAEYRPNGEKIVFPSAAASKKSHANSSRGLDMPMSTGGLGGCGSFPSLFLGGFGGASLGTIILPIS